MATVSSSVAENGVVVQAVHAGVNYAYALYNSGGNKTPFSMSVSDAIAMMNLPRDSYIIAAWLGGICADGNRGFSLGDPGSTTRHGTKSISATYRNQIAFECDQNTKYSVSDDKQSYALTLNLQDATSVSGSMTVELGVLWIKR